VLPEDVFDDPKSQSWGLQAFVIQVPSLLQKPSLLMLLKLSIIHNIIPFLLGLQSSPTIIPNFKKH